jgi:hypothetical protein
MIVYPPLLRRAVSGPSVADDLRDRVQSLRKDRWTRQGVCDLFNADWVPTARGGTAWRPSALQAAEGYVRPRRRRRADLPTGGRRRS